MTEHLHNAQPIRDLRRLVKMTDQVQEILYTKYHDYLSSMNGLYMTVKQFETVVSLLSELRDKQLAGYKSGDKNTSFLYNRADNIRNSQRHFIKMFVFDCVAGGRKFSPTHTARILALAWLHCTMTDYFTVSGQLLHGGDV